MGRKNDSSRMARWEDWERGGTVVGMRFSQVESLVHSCAGPAAPLHWDGLG